MPGVARRSGFRLGEIGLFTHDVVSMLVVFLACRLSWSDTEEEYVYVTLWFARFEIPLYASWMLLLSLLERASGYSALPLDINISFYYSHRH